jgi:glutathione synthase/RimK-type ligase-like ATP-grasp enzyme
MATEKKEFDKPRDNKSEQNIAGVKELADVCLDNGKEEHDLQDAFDAVLRGGTQKGAKTLVIYLSAYGAMGAPFHKTVFFEAYSELIELITARGHRAVIARGSSYQQDGQFSSYFTYNEAEKTYEHVKEPVTADLILNRDSENTIPRIEDCTILNHPDFDEICRDKVKTAEHLEEVSGVTRIVNSYAEAQEAFEAIPSDLIVMKPRFGEQAFGVYILERSKIDESLYEDWSDIIVQEFLDSSQGIPGLVEGVHEINIFAVNGTFAGARMKKPPEGELISSATGAVVGEVWGLHRDQIPDELWQETQKISEQFSEFRPQLFRADFVRNSDGRYKLIEINSRPGLMHQDKEGADFYMDFNGRIVDAVDEFLSSLES